MSDRTQFAYQSLPDVANAENADLHDDLLLLDALARLSRASR